MKNIVISKTEYTLAYACSQRLRIWIDVLFIDQLSSNVAENLVIAEQVSYTDIDVDVDADADIIQF